MVAKEVGIVGLGRMGSGLASRVLSNSRIKVVVWNRSRKPVQRLVKKGAIGAKSVGNLVKSLERKRVIWLMLPAGDVTEKYFQEALKYCINGDVIIDGGNSHFKDSIRRHDEALKKGIQFLDVGVSGGIHGEKRGFGMMISGKHEAFRYCEPLFKEMCMKEGYSHVSSEPGAGHYVKMVHNSIEYGMIQAMGEGFNLLKDGRFNQIDLKKTARVWNNGGVISGFLMEMAENAFKNGGVGLNKIAPYVEDFGEGEWAAIEALEMNVPYVVNSYAVEARRISRDLGAYSFKFVSAIRKEFGGHKVKKK